MAFQRNNYYDIDDILAGQERVPCVLRTDLDGIGSSDSTSKVHRNARWALPYWMADRLNEEDYVDMEAPIVFSKKANRIYAASPESIQLRAICQYYYQLGLQLGDMVVEIPQVLRNMYMRRLVKIAQIARQHHQNADSLDFVQTLDKTETRMLRLCQRSQSAITDWQQGNAYTLKKAPVVNLSSSTPT